MSTAKGKKGTRNYGNGSIYPKPNGKGFIGEIFVVINGEKKRKKVSGRTKTDVRIKLRELQNNAEAGLLDTKPEEKGIVFYDFAIDFIERRAKFKGIEKTSETRDTYSLKKMGDFANLYIQDMSEELIERFFLENITISQSYINKIFQLMNRVFNEAIRKQIISENPMRWLEKPKSAKPTKIIRALTVSEEQRLLEVLKNEDILYAPQMLLSLFTGCRMGEVNALEVRDFDPKNKLLRIRKTVSEDNGGVTIHYHTKTYHNRDLSLSDDVADFLSKCIGEKEDGFIFLSSAGTIVSTSQVNTEFKKALEKYDILDNTLDGDVTCHSCRHTYATRFLESGSGVKVLQSLLGHSEIKITLGVYCDVQDSFKQAQLETSNKYLEKNKLSIL